MEVVDDEDRIPIEDEAKTRRQLKDRVSEMNCLLEQLQVVQDEKPVTFYKFGPRKTQSIAIDVSLNKLNKCIKVAYK